MQFQDPLDVKCTNCGNTAAYSVNSLMCLKAQCFSCGSPLDEAGLTMRKGRDDNFKIFGVAELILDIEEIFTDKITSEFADNDMDNINTVNDIILLTKSRINEDIDRITRIVFDLIEKSIEIKQQNITLNSTFTELFKHDWNKRCSTEQ